MPLLVTIFLYLLFTGFIMSGTVVECETESMHTFPFAPFFLISLSLPLGAIDLLGSQPPFTL